MSTDSDSNQHKLANWRNYLEHPLTRQLLSRAQEQSQARLNQLVNQFETLTEVQLRMELAGIKALRYLDTEIQNEIDELTTKIEGQDNV